MRGWSPNFGWAALASAVSVSSVAFGLAIGSWLAPEDATSRARDVGAAMSLDAPGDEAWQEVSLQRPETLAEQRTQRREESRRPCTDETVIHLDDPLPPGLLAATEIRPGDIDLPLPPGLHAGRSSSLRLRDLDAALPLGLDEPASRRAPTPPPPVPPATPSLQPIPPPPPEPAASPLPLPPAPPQRAIDAPLPPGL